MVPSRAKLKETAEQIIQMASNTGVKVVRNISMGTDGRPQWAVVYVTGTEATEELLRQLETEDGQQ